MDQGEDTLKGARRGGGPGLGMQFESCALQSARSQVFLGCTVEKRLVLGRNRKTSPPR